MDTSFSWQWNTGQRDLHYTSAAGFRRQMTQLQNTDILFLRKLLGSQMKGWADPTRVGILQLLMWAQSQAASHKTEGLSWAFCMQTDIFTNSCDMDWISPVGSNVQTIFQCRGNWRAIEATQVTQVTNSLVLTVSQSFSTTRCLKGSAEPGTCWVCWTQTSPSAHSIFTLYSWPQQRHPS